MMGDRPIAGGSGVKPLMITAVGTGPYADAWARAWRGVDAVEIDRIPGATEDELLAQFSRADIDAVAFASPIADIGGAIRRAVMAGRHVFVATPAALDPKQLLALDGLAQRRSRVILFDACGLGDERLSFVRKMTTGAHALWKPRYVRALCTGSRLLGETIDELAIHEIATLLSLAAGLPSRVAAVSPRIDDETGASDVAMLTLSFDGGPVVRLDVSVIEPVMRREIVIACDGRTIVLDALDTRAPLQIQAAARYRGPKRGGQWAETIHEHPIGDMVERRAAAASTFIAAVRSMDAGATNARVLAGAALVWETARASMARGGEPLALPASHPLVDARRPSLQLIRGGGHTDENRPGAGNLSLVAALPQRSA